MRADCGAAATGDCLRSAIWMSWEAGLSFQMNTLLGTSSRRSLIMLALCGGMAAAPVSAQVRPLGMVPVATQAQAVKPAPAKPTHPKPATDVPVPGDPNYAPD